MLLLWFFYIILSFIHLDKKKRDTSCDLLMQIYKEENVFMPCQYFLFHLLYLSELLKSEKGKSLIWTKLVWSKPKLYQ